MNIESVQSPVTNRQPLSGERGDPSRLREAAKEFEALMIEAMFRSMRSTLSETGEAQKGFGQEIYSDLIYRELARSMSRGSGLGVAELLEQGVLRGMNAPFRAKLTAGPLVTDSMFALPTSRHVNRSRPQQAPADTAPALSLPVSGRISSSFGWRRDPIEGEKRFHRGVDIAAKKGTPVVAAEEGRVVYSGRGPQYGNVVVVEHANGMRSLYAHLSEREVEEGDSVTRMQTIGQVGSTGRSTGPHLHFEVYKNQQLTDPMTFLDRRSS